MTTVEATGHLRVYTDPAGAAELMRRLVGNARFEATLGEEDGHWFVDVRDVEGALRRVVDLVAEEAELGTVSFATVCAGGRTFTFPSS